jgi:hypothetical protein
MTRNTFSLLTGVVFLAVAVAHALRLAFNAAFFDFFACIQCKIVIGCLARRLPRHYSTIEGVI